MEILKWIGSVLGAIAAFSLIVAGAAFFATAFTIIGTFFGVVVIVAFMAILLKDAFDNWR